MYNWVTLLYSRNQHNIVNQLYFKKKKKNLGVPVVSQWVKNLKYSVREDAGLIPGLPQWVKDPVLLLLWHRLAATAPV